MNWRLVVAVAISMYGVVLVMGLVVPLLLIAGQASPNQDYSYSLSDGVVSQQTNRPELDVVLAFENTAH